MSDTRAPRPVLALPGTALDAHRDAYLSFYRQVHADGARVRRRLADRFAHRLGELLPPSCPRDLLHPHEVFDPRSGAVRLREWEAPASGGLPRAQALFRLGDGAEGDTASWLRSLTGDTSVLLRGALYWIPYARETRPELAPRYPALAAEFLDEAAGVLDELGACSPSMTAYKYLAAIHDVTRSILLHLVTASFLAETDRAAADHPVTRRVLDAALRSCGRHRMLLLGVTPPEDATLPDVPGPGWSDSVQAAATSVAEAAHALRAAERGLGLSGLLSDPHTAGRLLRERHSDDFLENTAAVGSGLAALVGEAPASRVVCVGLVSGGVEFSLLAASLLAERETEHAAMLLRLSLYQEHDTADDYRRLLDQQRTGQDAGVETPAFPGALLASPEPLRADDLLLILDDNIMSGRTLQVAADLLATRGQVIGAVASRYPGINLHAHMRAHGTLNPRELLRFVHGLMTPMAAGRSADGTVHKGELRITGYLERAMRKETS
jgi:hypothetical protein